MSNVIFSCLLVALLLKSLVALSSLRTSQLGVLLFEDRLHNKVIHLEEKYLQIRSSRHQYEEQLAIRKNPHSFHLMNSTLCS